MVIHFPVVIRFPRKDGTDQALVLSKLLYVGMVVRKLEVYKLHRDRDGFAHNWYIDKDGWRVSSRASEHGPYAPPSGLRTTERTDVMIAQTGGIRGAAKT